MSSPPVIQLPLDLSGVAPTNKVVGERHTVLATGTRAFVTTRGPFYTRGMVVRNRTTGAALAPDVDYRPVHLFIEASLRAGQEICSVVIILPACRATDIEIDYQAVGGEYSASVSAIEQMLDGLDLDNRTVKWGDIIGAPEYFPPTAHLHDIGDVYGFEYLVAVLEQIRRAILLGDQAAFDELRQYIDLKDNELRALITSLDSLVNDHINNTNNPHNVTKAQVNLGNVQNYGIATTAQAQTGTDNASYMTPLRVKEAVTFQVGNALNAHIARVDNPHSVTKAQVQLGNVVNYGLATTAQAQAGLGEAYMTATLTGAAITALALTPLNAHIARQDNPHNVSKTQVQLGNVDNFATATTAQAQAGTATNLFMTPAGTRTLIMAVAGDALAAHVNNTNNPHNTTATQVGLGNVQNYDIATTAQATAGTDNATYMTPLRTKEAITSQAVTPLTNSLNAHTSRTDNPHNTTATQVGLGNVLNYGMSDQGNAESGGSNTLYMSPLRTRQAIVAIAYNPLQAQINDRVVTGSNATLNTLVLGNSGYFYQDGDGSITLRVAGSRFFQFQAGGNFVTHNGRVVAGAGFQPSDKRLKKHIGLIDARPLWRGFDFKKWEMKDSGEHQVGPIAQDLQKVAPDLVIEYDHGVKRKSRRLAVNNTGLALEMSYAAGVEIDQLHEKLVQQQNVIDSLLARLTALESK